MCRAQFERDDLAEADAVLGYIAHGNASDGEGSTENAQSSEPAQQEQGLIGSSRFRSSLLHVRIPTWINFDSVNVKTVKKRDNPLRRNPIPFQSDKDKPEPYTQLASPASALGDDLPAPAPRRAEAHRQAPGHLSLHDHDPIFDLKAVIPHPPPPTWDDQHTADLPYDNPYYTRAISHELWLPRNPFGDLDLDDTVSLKVSIAVDSKSRELGTWLGVPVTSSPEIDMTPGHPGVPFSLEKQDHSTSHPALQRHESRTSEHHPSPPRIVEPSESNPEAYVDGSETIIYREGLKRAKSYGLDIATSPRRPSTAPRRPSTAPRKASGSSLGSSFGMHRLRSDSTYSRGPGSKPPYRSFSQSSGVQPSLLGASSIFTIKSPGRTHYAEGIEDDPALQPDIHAQGEMVQQSQTNLNNSRLSIPMSPAPLSRAQNISTSSAIAHEVMAEETDNFITRVEEEEAEARKAMNSRSWLTSWAYKKRK